MTFFDTNILVYATIDQGRGTLQLAERCIEDAIRTGRLYISPLVLSEYIFILSKLKIVDAHHEDILFFSKFVYGELDRGITMEAYELCKRSASCKHMNDAVHVKTAEIYCDRLVTFDGDFKKFRQYTELDIEILG